ncbi:MAG: hypothetical protein ABEJ30_04945 [Halorientalis sp.]
MSDDGDAADEVRVWLVERDYNDKGLVTLVYATPDGERAVQQNRSSRMLSRQGVTAATTLDGDRLSPVEDADRRERYAHEATRMAERHAPDEEV